MKSRNPNRAEPLPIDYCPHCCCNHVIGEHPKDDETEQAYWRRMGVKLRRTDLPAAIRCD